MTRFRSVGAVDYLPWRSAWWLAAARQDGERSLDDIGGDFCHCAQDACDCRHAIVLPLRRKKK